MPGSKPSFVFSSLWLLGTKGEKDPAVIRRYRVTNLLTFTFFWLALPFLFVLTSLPEVQLIIVGSSCSMVFVFWLNCRKAHLFARLWLVFSVLTTAVLEMAFLNSEAAPELRLSPQLLLFSLVALPLALFELEEREALWSSVIAIIVAFFFFQTLDGLLNLSSSLPESIYYSNRVYWFLSAECFLIIILCFNYFKQSGRSVTRQLQRAYQQIEARGKEIAQIDSKLEERTQALAIASEQLEQTRLQLLLEENRLSDYQHQLGQTELKLRQREKILERQEAQERIIANYDKIFRENLAKPLPILLEGFLTAISQDYCLWLGVAYLCDPFQEQLDAIAAFAYPGSKLPQLRIPIGETLLGLQAQKRAPLYLENLPEGSLTIDASLVSLEARCLFLVPLLAGQQLVGMLELAFGEPVKQQDQDMILKIASNLAVLVQGIRAGRNLEFVGH